MRFVELHRACAEGSADPCAFFGLAGPLKERVDKEFRQVFVPEQCSLRMLDPAHFDEVMAGRRLIMFGDSIMRIQWLSLACLLRSVVRTKRSQE